MKTEEILKLIDAGYTKDEISAMTAEPEAEQPEPADNPPDPEQPQQEDPPAEAQNELAEVRQELKTTQQQLADLVKQMQRNNLATASVNILPENDLDKKCDEAMAELIRPKIERKGD